MSSSVRLTTFVVLALTLVLTGCFEEPPYGAIITNDLASDVEIVYLKAVSTAGVRLKPNETRIFTFDLSDEQPCSTSDVIARSLDGTVVARIPAPVCRDRSFRLSDYPVR